MDYGLAQPCMSGTAHDNDAALAAALGDRRHSGQGPERLVVPAGSLGLFARGRRDRALPLFGFVGALRRTELVALRAEDVAIVADGLRLRIRRGKTRQGRGLRLALPRGRHVEPCSVRASEAWQAVARRMAGPLFRKSAPGTDRPLILAHRVAMAGIVSAHALRVGLHRSLR
jgi:integrase